VIKCQFPLHPFNVQFANSGIITTNINLYFNCKQEACILVLPFDITVALLDDGGNYEPKHVVVNVMNILLYSHL
jgi:hypothetical protein